MPDGWVQPQGAQDPHTADAQHKLLADAHFVVAAIEPGAQFPVLGRVALHIRVHQIERDAPDLNAPDFRIDRASRQVHVDQHRLALGIHSRGGGDFREVELLVEGFLGSVAGDALGEVALGIEKAHADERQAQIAGLFAVVAAENTQTATVDGQGLVQAELRAEIGDGGSIPFTVGAPVPGVGGRVHIGVEVGQDCGEAGQPFCVGRGLVEQLLARPTQKAHRVLVDGPPQFRVQRGKERLGVGVPAPPEIVGQLLQPDDILGQMGRNSNMSQNLHK